MRLFIVKSEKWCFSVWGTGVRLRCFYLSMFPVQVDVVLLHSGELVLRLLELCLPDLDLLILPSHLQQGLHLVGPGQRLEVKF